jgi:8-oxo-dGTP diphosphatase
MEFRKAESETRLAQQQIAVAVVEHDGRFLVGLRPAGKPLAGLSEFPGGKVHPGETPAEAAERECREETGLSVVVGDPYPIVKHDYPHGRLTLHFFRCILAEPIVDATPIEPFCWVGHEELARLEFPEANRALLEALRRRP